MDFILLLLQMYRFDSVRVQISIFRAVYYYYSSFAYSYFSSFLVKFLYLRFITLFRQYEFIVESFYSFCLPCNYDGLQFPSYGDRNGDKNKSNDRKIVSLLYQNRPRLLNEVGPTIVYRGLRSVETHFWGTGVAASPLLLEYKRESFSSSNINYKNICNTAFFMIINDDQTSLSKSHYNPASLVLTT